MRSGSPPPPDEEAALRRAKVRRLSVQSGLPWCLFPALHSMEA